MPHGMHALNAHARMYYGNSVRLNKTKIGYEPAGLTVHPPPQNDRGWVHFFSYGCLVPPKFFPKKKWIL